jgi:hypothetical protein
VSGGCLRQHGAVSNRFIDACGQRSERLQQCRDLSRVGEMGARPLGKIVAPAYWNDGSAIFLDVHAARLVGLCGAALEPHEWGRRVAFEVCRERYGSEAMLDEGVVLVQSSPVVPVDT